MPGDFTWDDIGDFDSLAQLLPVDTLGDEGLRPADRRRRRVRRAGHRADRVRGRAARRGGRRHPRRPAGDHAGARPVRQGRRRRAGGRASARTCSDADTLHLSRPARLGSKPCPSFTPTRRRPADQPPARPDGADVGPARRPGRGAARRARRDPSRHPRAPRARAHRGADHRARGRAAARRRARPRSLLPGSGLLCDIGPGPAASGRKRIALRADLDALPVQDTSGVPWASTVRGVAHACGHDVHTTAVLGAGLALAQVADELRTGRAAGVPARRGGAARRGARRGRRGRAGRRRGDLRVPLRPEGRRRAGRAPASGPSRPPATR